MQDFAKTTVNVQGIIVHDDVTEITS